MNEGPGSQELVIAPRVVFDRLAQLGPKPRFKVPHAEPGAWSDVSWNAFADMIRAVACGLRHRGFKHGERAAIFAPNRVEWAAAALGIQAGGGAMVPIYPSSTSEQAGYVLSHSDATVLFVDTEPLLRKVFEAGAALEHVRTLVIMDSSIDGAVILADYSHTFSELELSSRQASLVTFDELTALGKATHEADLPRFGAEMAAVDLDDIAVMLYTSGTSGPPKGVPLTHRNVAANGADWLECNGPLLTDSEESDLLWLPLSHIFGFGEMCLGNSLGFTTWLSSPAQVLDHLAAVSPTVFMSVPSLFEKLAMAAMGTADEAQTLREVTGGRLRFCLSGGAGLKVAVKECFQRAGLLIIEGYGLTEAAPTLTLNRPDAFRFDTVGLPLPSVELKLAPDGEILARGPNIFGGYHKDPAATAEAFTEDGWLKTGDVGRFTDDGFLQIIDRKKDILVTAGGKNVAPANIEIRFKDDALIDHLVVYGDSHKYLVAGVWPNEEALVGTLATLGLADDETNRRTLIDQRIAVVNETLARFETIKKYALLSPALTVENGLLTPTLKVKRKAVTARFGDELEALYG